MTQTEALRLALEALESTIGTTLETIDLRRKAITAIKAALEAKDEPVAWREFDGEGGYYYSTYEDNEDYAVKWDAKNPKHKGWVEPLYTTPPQRKPLTDDDLSDIADVATKTGNLYDLRLIIEAKLKEKNNG
jgi:hypothetical protein